MSNLIRLRTGLQCCGEGTCVQIQKNNFHPYLRKAKKQSIHATKTNYSVVKQSIHAKRKKKAKTEHLILF